MNKGYVIALVLCYLLAIAAIAISLWRCEPFQIDTVAVLANILALMVTILLGIIAYNYFIQKSEVDKFKSHVKEEISKETIDIYINIMNSFGASTNTASLFPLGVTVLSRLNPNEDKDVTQICTLLNLCHGKMPQEVKSNPVITTCINQLKELLPQYKTNVAAMQLLSTIQ